MFSKHMKNNAKWSYPLQWRFVSISHGMKAAPYQHDFSVLGPARDAFRYPGQLRVCTCCSQKCKLGCNIYLLLVIYLDIHIIFHLSCNQLFGYYYVF